MSAGPLDSATNPTIFLRLNESRGAPREIAWDEFGARYAPIITAFARRLGARPQDVDDVVQDVLLDGDDHGDALRGSANGMSRLLSTSPRRNRRLGPVPSWVCWLL